MDHGRYRGNKACGLFAGLLPICSLSGLSKPKQVRTTPRIHYTELVDISHTDDRCCQYILDTASTI